MKSNFLFSSLSLSLGLETDAAQASLPDDPTPSHQVIDTIETLRATEAPESSHAVLTIPGIEEHGFEYWDSYDNTPAIFGLPPDVPRTVHDDVVYFLDQNLKQCTDCPNSKLTRPTPSK